MLEYFKGQVRVKTTADRESLDQRQAGHSGTRRPPPTHSGQGERPHHPCAALTVLLPSASLSNIAGRLVPLLLACMGHNRI